MGNLRANGRYRETLTNRKFIFMKLPRVHNSAVKTRFPTKFNPVRSAYKQQILTPAGVSYNPAPSAPTPLETPAAFLPKRELELRSYIHENKAYNVSSMPLISKPPRRTYHLTAEDAEKIQTLRDSEPSKWTRKRLAEEFKVSEFVIGMVSKPNEAYAKEMQSRLGLIREQWDDKRSRARDQRMRRKKFWLRDA